MNKQNKLINTEKLIIARRLGSGDMGKRIKGIKRHKYNINQSQGYNVELGKITNITITLYSDRWVVEVLL